MATTASTEKMNMEKDDLPKKKFINTNLLSLKFLLFIFFGGELTSIKIIQINGSVRANL